MEYLSPLIEKIKPKPAMYLGSENVKVLYDFLGGYNMALHDLGIIEKNDKLVPLSFGFFHEYVAQKLDFYESTSGWCNMILCKTDNCKKKGLALFFELFNTFKKMRIKTIYNFKLSQHHIDFHTSNTVVKRLIDKEFIYEPMFKNPLEVSYAKLTDDAGLTTYIGIVDTQSEVYIFRRFFREKDCLINFLNLSFGETLGWNKIDGDNISFSKKVIF